MKQILIFIVLVFFSFNNGYSDDWKVKNKWKISCGVVDKEALIVNGKPKKYSKKEFKLIDVVFKLDKGDIGSCPTDKKPAGGFPYSGRQEITHKLSPGYTIFEANIEPNGAPQYRSHFFRTQ